MNILVTGCAGFIGSHTCEELIIRGHLVIGIDSLTYAANLSNISSLESKEKFKFFHCDINDTEEINKIIENFKITHILNFAAETHVDNSIRDVIPFVRSNVLGICSLIESIKKNKICLIHISTDEVYGVPESGQVFTEESPLNPRNPYSATKSAADHLILAAINTHNIRAKIIRPSNNFGPRQHKEKFIPTVLRSIYLGNKVPVYGDGMQLREWTFVKDTARSIADFIVERINDDRIIYNLSSEYQITNIEVIQRICELIREDYLEKIDYIEDRPGHDREYKIKNSLLINPTSFLDGLKETVDFNIKNGEYL